MSFENHDGKARLVSFFERLQALAAILGLSTYATILLDPAPNALGLKDMAELLSVGTGLRINSQEPLMIGGRIHNLI